MKRFDVQVHGDGIVGRSLALSLAGLGLQVALHEAGHGGAATGDVRAYALNAASLALLRRLKVWDALPRHAATAVHDMRIEGDAAGARLDFSGWEQAVSELAWIVDAGALETQLAAAVRFSPHITRIQQAVAADDNDAHASVDACAANTTAAAARAPLTALCEGAASARRQALGVAFERQRYGHSAIAARLTASRSPPAAAAPAVAAGDERPAPHNGIARQWFRSPDVLALLPLDTPRPGASYGLVWSMPEARAAELLAGPADDFAQAVNEATGGAAGLLALASPRHAWPLSRATASSWCGPGWVLLGDAAHVIHPLAGQGLNLGLADVAALTAVIAAREPWRGLGDARLLRRYVRERQLPTEAMSRLTDGLLQLFAEPAPALRELRNRGLGLVNAATPLKRWLTARALGR